MDYLATFHTHYAATCYDRYCRSKGITAKMQPVPRTISASCGTCVRFTAQVPPKISEHEDMERCYLIAKDGDYTPVEG